MPDVDEAELLRRAEQRAQVAKDAEADRELSQMREWSHAVYSVLADIRANLPRLLEFSEDSLQVIDTKGGKRIGWVFGSWTKELRTDYSKGVWLLLIPSGAMVLATTFDAPTEVSDRELLSLLRAHNLCNHSSTTAKVIRALHAKANLPEPTYLDAMVRLYHFRLPWDRLGEALGEPPPPAVQEPPASRSRWGRGRRR
jgi:hypothetical protein